MSDPIGVSIIIPNYNYGRFIGEAIDSALAQTHAPVEVIVVDDGSTDESRTVIESYGDRIKAIFQENAGQTRACAVGFEVSRYPLVIFLDADDRLVAEAAAIAAADWPAGVSKKQFLLQLLDQDGKLLDRCWPKISVNLTPDDIRQSLLTSGYYPCPPTSGNVFSRTYLDQIAPFDDHPFIDSVLSTLAPLYGDVVSTNVLIAHYRLHGSNMTRMYRVSSERLARYLAADDLRVKILEEHCDRIGVQFSGQDVLRGWLPYREVKTVIAKLNEKSWGDMRYSVASAAAAVRAGFLFPQSTMQQLLRSAWIVAVSILPRRLALLLIDLRYDSPQRPVVLERLIDLFGRVGRAR
jgi:glycosyltransferase involved in cell wall biosynthesis